MSTLVLIHGFTDTPRTWELVVPRLQETFDVLAPALPGHLGGEPLGELDRNTTVDAVERALDDAHVETAHVAGSSLGGYVALKLAERGRARSVVAFAPAGGWDPAGSGLEQTMESFVTLNRLVRRSAPRADAIAATPAGRRSITQNVTVRHEHIPPDLAAHLIVGAAACDALPLIDLARREGYPLEPSHIECPLRIVWGTDDAVLPWPSAAVRYRQMFPHADWVVLDDVGHCPQLDVPLEAAELILGFAHGV